MAYNRSNLEDVIAVPSAPSHMLDTYENGALARRWVVRYREVPPDKSMRLLLIAGLRQNLSWFKWVERHAVEFDIVAIVGDMLDVFHPLPPHAQTIKARTHLESLAGKAYVVVCSS